MRTLRRTGLLATLLSLGLLTACGGEDEGSGTEVKTDATFAAGTTMAKLKDAGKVRVGTKFDQPLFGLKGLSGEPEGFDVEIAKIIAGELGVKPDAVEYVETPSKVREEAIEQGRVDYVVATYTINDKRKQRISFAGPYYVAGQTIMVRKDDGSINGPDDLKSGGKKVCSVTGSTPAENIKKYASASQIVLFDVYSKCADALKNKQVDAVTTDNVILLGLVSENEDAFKLVGEPFTQEPYGIGIKKGDTKFCEFINGVLKKASDDGRYKKAWEDTAGKAEGAETPTLPELAPCS